VRRIWDHILFLIKLKDPDGGQGRSAPSVGTGSKHSPSHSQVAGWSVAGLAVGVTAVDELPPHRSGCARHAASRQGDGVGGA